MIPTESEQDRVFPDRESESGQFIGSENKIIHTYPTDRHVGASLELFASVALMFWYILSIMMRLSRR